MNWLCNASLEMVRMLQLYFTDYFWLYRKANTLVLSHKAVSSSAGHSFCPITPATLLKSLGKAILHFSEGIAKGWKSRKM